MYNMDDEGEDYPSVRVDPYDYFANHRGRRLVRASAAQGRGHNTSQILLGTDVNSIQEAALARSREHLALRPQQVNTAPREASGPSVAQRRPRGPGTAYSQRILEQGFPSDVAWRKRQHEAEYQYDPDTLHVHKKPADLTKHANRSSLNLFAYQTPPAHLEAMRSRLRVTFAPRDEAAASLEALAGPRCIVSSGEDESSPLDDGLEHSRERHRQPWERVDYETQSWWGASAAQPHVDWRDAAAQRFRRRQQQEAGNVCERLRLWCDIPVSKAALRDPWAGF